MKKMLVALMCILTLVMLSACNGSQTVANADPTPLTHASSYEGFVCTSNLQTEEGIVINCSENYMMGNATDGFWFSMTDQELDKEEPEWTIEMTSNAKIVKTDFYDYEGNLLGSEDCNGTVIIGKDYNGKYCDRVTLYIKDGKDLYSAHFWRTGR